MPHEHPRFPPHTSPPPQPPPPTQNVARNACPTPQAPQSALPLSCTWYWGQTSGEGIHVCPLHSALVRPRAVQYAHYTAHPTHCTLQTRHSVHTVHGEPRSAHHPRARHRVPFHTARALCPLRWHSTHFTTCTMHVASALYQLYTAYFVHRTVNFAYRGFWARASWARSPGALHPCSPRKSRVASRTRSKAFCGGHCPL